MPRTQYIVEVFVGDRRLEDLTPEEMQRLRQHVARTMWPACVAYAEIELRREMERERGGGGKGRGGWGLIPGPIGVPLSRGRTSPCS